MVCEINPLKRYLPKQTKFYLYLHMLQKEKENSRKLFS